MTYKLPEPFYKEWSAYTVAEVQEIADAAYVAGLAEGRKVTEVWSVSSKVFSVLFATEAQADQFIAGTTATMGATKDRLNVLQPEPKP